MTTTHVCLLIVCLFMLVIGLIVNNKMKHATEVPGMVQNIAELYVEMMDGVDKCVPIMHSYKLASREICPEGRTPFWTRSCPLCPSH